jgi:hypothetical protein
METQDTENRVGVGAAPIRLRVLDLITAGAALVLIVASASRWYHAAVAPRGAPLWLLGGDGPSHAGAPVAQHVWTGSQTICGLLALLVGLAVVARVFAEVVPRLARSRLGRVQLGPFLIASSAMALLATIGGFLWRPEVAAVPSVTGGPADVAVSLGLPLALLAALLLGLIGVGRLPVPRRAVPARVYRFPATRGDDARRDSRPS